MKTSNRFTNKFYLPIFALILAAVFFAASSFESFAASAPSASGRVNSKSGAYIRKSSNGKAKKLALLKDNTKLVIYKEVFKSKTSTSAKKKWYYVKAGSKKGYIRSDLVDGINYKYAPAKVTSAVYYRKGAGTKMKSAGRFKKNTGVYVCLASNPVSSAKGSSKTWYKIRKGSKYYYVASSKIKITGSALSAYPSGSSASKATGAYLSDAEFEKYMNNEGFPESYKVRLRNLHRAHPNWGFEAYHVNANWADALAKQTRNKVSLVHGSFPKSYRKNNTQIEPSWYNASNSVVAYYMDPRNFLSEDRIYMFEDLSYKPAYHKAGVVNSILSGCSLPSYGFSGDLFIAAAKKYKVSPTFLAARARQETGSGGDAVSGCKVLGTRVYNPFNIGAFGGTNPLWNGLLYAKAKGWTTQAKAVEGGAYELSKNYIKKGQNTIYYQRFNVKNGAGSIGTHQYMTNIMAHYSEAYSTKKSYVKYGLSKQPLLFSIPVYNAMPSSTKLP